MEDQLQYVGSSAIEDKLQEVIKESNYTGSGRHHQKTNRSRYSGVGADGG